MTRGTEPADGDVKLGLEPWDPQRFKWVLYRSQSQHTADCERYPLSAMPRRVFLDTNVVNLLVRYSEQVFEQAPLPYGLTETRAHDIEALMHVFYVGARADWDILGSRKVLDEISQTPDADLKAELLDYAVHLVEPPSEDGDYAANLGRRLINAPFTAGCPTPPIASSSATPSDSNVTSSVPATDAPSFVGAIR